MSQGPYEITHLLPQRGGQWQVSGPGIEPRGFTGDNGCAEATQLHLDLCAAHNAGWSAGQLAMAKIHRELEQTKSVIADGTVGMKRGE